MYFSWKSATWLQSMPKSHHAFEMWQQKNWHFLMSGITVKSTKYSVDIPWHPSAPCLHIFPCSINHQPLWKYWRLSILIWQHLDRLSINLQDFKQKIPRKAPEWPPPLRGINATWTISPGSDYKGETALQITHLPLRFSETMRVFPTLTLNVFWGDHQGFVLIQIFSTSLCGKSSMVELEIMCEAQAAFQPSASLRWWDKLLPLSCPQCRWQTNDCEKMGLWEGATRSDVFIVGFSPLLSCPAHNLTGLVHSRHAYSHVSSCFQRKQKKIQCARSS